MNEEQRKSAAADIIKDHGTDVEFLDVAEALSWFDVAREEWRGPTEEDLEKVWDLVGRAKVEVTWEQ